MSPGTCFTYFRIRGRKGAVRGKHPDTGPAGPGVPQEGAGPGEAAYIQGAGPAGATGTPRGPARGRKAEKDWKQGAGPAPAEGARRAVFQGIPARKRGPAGRLRGP